MSQTLLEMAKELVMAQIQARQIPPENLNSALQSTYDMLSRLEASEGGDRNGNAASATAPQVAVDWKSSIKKNSVTCLECGESFKQLSLRHLKSHDLDPRSYRTKYKIPRTQALSARAVTARRRELAQEIRPWELAPTKTKNGAAKTNGTAAKANGTAAKAKPAARSRKRTAKV